MSLSESFYCYLQDRAPLDKVFGRGEGRVGDNVERMTLGSCLQRRKLGMPQGWAGLAQAGSVSKAVASGLAVSCPAQSL